jgi:hypothetical protein
MTVFGRISAKKATKVAACAEGGKVAITVKRGRKTLSKRTVGVTGDCTFKAPLAVRGGTFTISVRFLGNKTLEAASARVR